MIKILFPPGCYGHYWARCIYSYTNLRKGQYQLFDFDSSGSSHSRQFINESKNCIELGHVDTLEITLTDTVVVVLPDQKHRLDYYNNQYHKASKKQLINFILSQFSIDDINKKLKDNWNYCDNFGPETPPWILREFFSFFIGDLFNSGYNVNSYKNVPHVFSLTTQDIFLNFLHIFNKACQNLNLSVTVPQSCMLKNHNNFLQAQQYHNIQNKCQKWVNDSLTDQPSISPGTTIFDEAYVQYYLRLNGYELKCDGLNTFPDHSIELKKIIYENSQNCNP
jgi:hypothetical protein